MRDIPLERLRELVRPDADTGKIYWLKKANPKAPIQIGAECGCPSTNGYRQARIDQVTLLTHRVVFALAHGRWPTQALDHINGDRADNRPANLREATPTQNGINRPTAVGASGVKGVTWEKGAWRARIRIDRKKVNLGRFADKGEAEAAYNAAAQQHHGQFRARYGSDAELLATTNQLIGETA